MNCKRGKFLHWMLKGIVFTFFLFIVVPIEASTLTPEILSEPGAMQPSATKAIPALPVEGPLPTLTLNPDQGFAGELLRCQAKGFHLIQGCE